MAANEIVKPIKWADQIAHFVSCFFLTLLTLGFGFPIAVLWAITREYYQTKITMYEVYRIEYPDLNWKQIGKQLTYKKVMGLVDLKKRDLVVSYSGIVAALLINVPFNIWLYMEVL
jgi:hypothetical protein